MEELLSGLQSLLVGMILAVALTLVAASVILLFFDTDSVKRRKLKQLATADYKQARGSAHRQLLEAAARAINMQLREYQRQINAAENQKRQYVRERENQVQATLVRWLVETKLQEVPGIGESLKHDIIRTVFNGNLNDLRRAYLVQGIGQQRQKAINRWIDHYQAQIPYRLNQYFPGKGDIQRRYEQAIISQESLIQEATRAQEPLKERLIPINRELEWLRKVTVQDFVRAYQDPFLEQGQTIDRYLKGVFAEWEPMPDWFRAEVASGAN